MKYTVNTIPHHQINIGGAGIASLASAAYFIMDGRIPADQITIMFR